MKVEQEGRSLPQDQRWLLSGAVVMFLSWFFGCWQSAVHSFSGKCTPALWLLAERSYRFVTNNPMYCFQENNFQ